MKPTEPTNLSRRAALKWLAGTAAAGAAAPAIAAPNETEPTPGASAVRSPLYDPDYAKPVFPWDKQLSPDELKIIGVLADIILPKDDNGPAASEVGVPEFINEWCSAPYGDNRDDCEVVRGGLGWLNTESFRRHEKRFDELGNAERIAIVDDICDPAKAKPEHKVGAAFFARFRQLCLGGYYTHSSTWKHLGYVGNVTIGGPYPGVPQAIIEKLGLQDVV
ncbi:gluconate 2-dehydrogenase subunit 3-like protein [Roseimicrobium gellanilyticum]|uniref:Gluconate 2-dehydrogenase subunit 3-like protein n=1 Tax=Roseimicrobium gellanilyticum TaxID=748857 RepID=A0A366HRQ2_9BACT|nr:gluconate 2-dehydrogenase subunit 3 family protein [Roseimicrobium gellanilyticum]RBP45758.1 gluconate 2-dehydrogenase subunit 3-like protein [Roseimicrobium gellanilyticum]